MRFSVSPAGGSTAELIEAAQVAEELGFDGFWLADSHMMRPDVFVQLAGIACATRRITIGTAVTHPIVRHPALIASAATALLNLAPGRVRLGIGVGDSGPASMHMRRATLKELEQAITGIKRLMAGEEMSWQGDVFKLGYRSAEPAPVYVAGASYRTQAMTGRVADGMMWGGGLDQLPEAIATVRTAERDAGRPAGSVASIMWTVVCLDDDREAARRAVRPQVARKAIWSLGALARRGQLDPADAEPLERLTAAYDEQRHGPRGDNDFVEERWIDRFSVAGTAGDVLARCRQIERDGAEEIGMIFRTPTPVQGAGREQIERFARAVIQPFRA